MFNTKNKSLIAFVFCSFFLRAQNDVDAIRYSRNGVGGSARFVALGGAMNAMGADLSCAAYNPAGLALFRKGELSFSGGLKITNNKGNLYNKSTVLGDAGFNFNNFGITVAFKDKKDPDSRHVLGFSNTQVQNFNTSVRITGYTNSNSIANDMLNLARESGNVNSLNYGYEGLGYNTFLLDTVDNQFFSFVDLKRSVKQTRDIVTSGRVNDINISYAYSYKDKFYFGASIGLPQLNYISTTTHFESDDKDSMRVKVDAASNYTTTYIDDLPAIYRDKLGFNSLTYTEYFKTTGSGVNLKLGGIYRASDFLRIGMYYHTSTFYELTDAYYNSLSVSFDANKNEPESDKYPGANGGTFSYRVVTPQRLSFNSAFIFKKLAVVGLEYELVDYRQAQLRSDNISDFIGVNSSITNKYSIGNNLKLGGEFNVKPMIVRAGYTMLGSPFGAAFVGNFVRNTFSLGAGFRTENNFYFDVVWAKTFSTENYYLFTTADTKAKLNYNTTSLAATVGIKF